MPFKATTPRRGKSGCTINGTAFFSIEAYPPALRLPSLPTRNKDQELGKRDYHGCRRKDRVQKRANNLETAPGHGHHSMYSAANSDIEIHPHDGEFATRPEFL
jgi:hypothetical protein